MLTIYNIVVWRKKVDVPLSPTSAIFLNKNYDTMYSSKVHRKARKC